MSNFIVYNSDKKILRTGSCPDTMVGLQANANEFVCEGTADDATQKMEFDGFATQGQPINPHVVNKTQAEIDAETPASVPDEERPATITNKQWQAIQDRVAALEKA